MDDRDEFDPEDFFHPPLSDELDLHTFRPNETKSVVEEYLSVCSQEGILGVRIIHGKGKSVQKTIVQRVLQRNPLVIEFYDAAPESGGWGATIVQLKKSTEV